MWCGCRPTDKFSTAAPQPFSTMDEEAGGGAIPVSSESPAQDGDWSRLMRLVPVRNPSIHGVDVEREMVLFDLRSGRSYRLDSVGAAVWRHCTGAATIQEIHHAVCAELGLSIERAQDGVLSCMAQWSHDGLLTQAEPARV